MFGKKKKLHGVVAILGRDGAGKTTLLQEQLYAPFFEKYRVVVLSPRENKKWKKGHKNVDEIHMGNEALDPEVIKAVLKEKDSIIVIDDADDIGEKSGLGSHFWYLVKKSAKKNQIIFTARKLPDVDMEYELIVFVYAPGSKLVVLKDKHRSEISWDALRDDALLKIAVLE